jgi:DNA-binding CsgD family transcriptional regulator
MNWAFYIKNIRTLREYNRFLERYSKDFGEPITLTPLEIEKLIQEVKNRKHLSNQFFTIEYINSYDVPFHLNIEKYLIIKGTMHSDKIFELIHLDYLLDFLQWGIAGYSYIASNRDMLTPLKNCYRITFPMKLKDEKYYWVQMETTPLTLDKDNNLLSIFNTYTITRPYDKREKTALIAEMWQEGFNYETWSQELRKLKFTRNVFSLTPRQKQILNLMRDNPELTNAQIAEGLGNQKDTVDTLKKQILSRARDSFPDTPFQTVKELILFLEEMGFFQISFFEQTA